VTDDNRLMPAFYAACEAISRGQAHEIVLDHTISTPDGGYAALEITVRRFDPQLLAEDT
jgi:hypothetical protein